jgi:transcriptional antiterminator RfaH
MMPILPFEPVMYPDTLWDGEGVARKDDQRWWCLHTKARQEKMLARALHARGIAYYLPQVVHESRTPAGRKIRSMVPLFTGYLFLLGDQYDRAEAIQGNHLANILKIEDQDGFERDLRRLHRLLDSGITIAPEPTFLVGDLVRILTGPLRGLVGTVTRRNGRDRFVAIVRFLGRGAAIDLQDWQVEPAYEYPRVASGLGQLDEPATDARLSSGAVHLR